MLASIAVPFMGVVLLGNTTLKIVVLRLGGYQNQLTVLEYTQVPDPNPKSTKSENYQGGLCIDTLYSVFLRYSDAQQSLRLMLERIIENTLDEKFKSKIFSDLG